MNQFARMGDQSPFGDFILQIQFQFPLLDHVKQKSGDVFGIHLAGMNGNFCWNIQWTYYYHTFVNNFFSGFSHGAIAAFVGSDIDNNRPRSHASHHLL